MKVKVNGVEQTPQAYLIDGNNYFKLRDLAMMLRETPSRFEVGYDSETKTVTMTPGKDYTPVGGELKRGEDQSASCTLSVCTLKIGDRGIPARAITSAAITTSSSATFRSRSVSPSDMTARRERCCCARFRAVWSRAITTSTQ